MQEYLEEATSNVENAKMGIVHFINDALKAAGANSATVKIGRQTIENVGAARPYNKTSSGGISPYVDIELIRANGSPVYIGLRTAKRKKFLVYRGKKLSRFAIPALQRGVLSLEVVHPDVREDFTASLLEHYLDGGYTHGSELTDACGRLPEKMKKKLLLGDKRYGGEVDYIMAIDKLPFRWNKFQIPTMKSGHAGNKFVISIGDARLFNKQEILANHDIYLYYKDVHDRTLYLGDDKVDRANLPALIGPKVGKSRPYGGGKLRVSLSQPYKSVFEVKPKNKRILKVGLLDRKALEQGINQSDGRDVAPRDRQLPSAFKNNLNYDERDEILSSLEDKIESGFKNLYRKELEQEQLDYFRSKLDDDYDDIELQRLEREMEYQIAKEIKKKYM